MKDKPIPYKGGLIMPGSEAYRLWQMKSQNFTAHMQRVHVAAVLRGEIKEAPNVGSA